jgi:hypothetical protein
MLFLVVLEELISQTFGDVEMLFEVNGPGSCSIIDIYNNTNSGYTFPDEVEEAESKYTVTEICWNTSRPNFPNIEGIVNLPKHLRILGEKAFANTNVTQVVFGNEIEEIGNECFIKSNIQGEISIFSQNNLYIGQESFYNTSITSATFSNSLRSIKYACFE